MFHSSDGLYKTNENDENYMYMDLKSVCRQSYVQAKTHICHLISNFISYRVYCHSHILYNARVKHREMLTNFHQIAVKLCKNLGKYSEIR